MPAGLTLLTVTGARPLAWSLCQRWLGRQDWPYPVHWLIVDDGPVPQALAPLPAGWTHEVIRPAPLWRPGHNTQVRNLLAGLARYRPGQSRGLVIVEDDDWYGPQWLRQVAGHLDQAELVGQAPASYYHLPSRGYHTFRNSAHASLCATALRGAALGILRQVLAERPRFVDLLLWQRFAGTKALFASNQVLGIKGLPGRAGIGMGHQPRGFRSDADGAWLRSRLGDEAATYLHLPGVPGPATAVVDQLPRQAQPRIVRPRVTASRPPLAASA